MIKKTIFLLGAFLCAACARPDYISDKEWQQINNPASSDTCATEFKALNVCAHVNWTKSPSSSEANEFILNLDGDLSSPDELSVILWMPSMGHGSAPVKLERISANQYRVFNVYFIMPGDWEVRLSLKKSGALLDQLFIPLMVP